MFNRALSAIVFLLPWSAAAAPVSTQAIPGLPASETAHYKLTWMGIPFGDAEVAWKEDATSYRASFTLKTSGVAAVFKPQNMRADVSGTKQITGQQWLYTPVGYRFDNEAKHKVTTIAYDAAGNVTALDTTPGASKDDEDSQPRPAVSQAGRDGGVDALTILAAFADAASSGASHARLTEFDGLRLMTLKASQEPDSGEQATGRTYGFSRIPLEGFTPKELAHAKKDAALTATIRPGLSRLPDEVDAKVLLGTVKIHRVP